MILSVSSLVLVSIEKIIFQMLETVFDHTSNNIEGHRKIIRGASFFKTKAGQGGLGKNFMLAHMLYRAHSHIVLSIYIIIKNWIIG